MVTGRGCWEPAINNAGEIVYVTKDPAGFLNVFSTIRGQLTRSTTNSLSSPSINDAGEVVYSDRVLDDGSLQVFSTVRGRLATPFPANLPAISDSGEVCYVGASSQPTIVYTDRRGPLRELAGMLGSRCDVNRAGEVVFRDRDAAGNVHIFSTLRGQLTAATPGNGAPRSVTINNRGEVAYVLSGIIFLTDGRFVAGFEHPIGMPIDMNDRGDVVFPLRDDLGFRIVLATRSPGSYPGLLPLRARIRRPPGFDVQFEVFPNRASKWIDPDQAGLLPVAILTIRGEAGESLDFDATTVDPLSVEIGPDAATIVVRSMSEIEDVDRDGDLDLVLFFQTRKIGIGCGASEVSLRGRTADGRFFSGTSQVSTPHCR